MRRGGFRLGLRFGCSFERVKLGGLLAGFRRSVFSTICARVGDDSLHRCGSKRLSDGLLAAASTAATPASTTAAAATLSVSTRLRWAASLGGCG